MKVSVKGGLKTTQGYLMSKMNSIKCNIANKMYNHKHFANKNSYDCLILSRDITNKKYNYCKSAIFNGLSPSPGDPPIATPLFGPLSET